jgi:hypothetical protein
MFVNQASLKVLTYYKYIHFIKTQTCHNLQTISITFDNDDYALNELIE